MSSALPQIGGHRDPYERLQAWGRRWRAVHPLAARRVRRAWCWWSWAALAMVLATLLLVPGTRPGLAVLLIVPVVLWRVWLLCRSKTISWGSYARALTAGIVLAPLIGVAELGVARSLGLAAGDPAVMVWVAGPLEEALKVAFLLLVLRLARQRARRLAVVDVALLGTALAAGVTLVEELARALTTGSALRVNLLALLPGWREASSGTRFAGHLVLTGLVALGIGLAIRLRPNLGRLTVILPLVLLVLAVLDHSLFNAAEAGALGVVPGWLEGLHRVLGAGRRTAGLFALLLLAGVVLDYRVLDTVRGALPALPGRSADARVADRAERLVAWLPRRLPEDAAAVFRRSAAAVPLVLRSVATACVQASHEVIVALAAARQGTLTWLEALALLRQRRKLGFALRIAPVDPLRVQPVTLVVRSRTQRLAGQGLLGAATLFVALGAAALALTAAAGAAASAGAAGRSVGGDGAAVVSGSASLAVLLGELARWWGELPGWQRGITAVGAGGVLILSGSGAGLAYHLALEANDVTLPGRGASFVREPGRATREFLRSLTPADVLIAAAGAALRRLVPAPLTRLGGIAEDAEELVRREANAGAFAELRVPLRLRAVRRVAEQADIGLDGVRIRVVGDPELVGVPVSGHTWDGETVELFPEAFRSSETLIRTLAHERTRIYQQRVFGPARDAAMLRRLQQAAHDAEEDWWEWWLGARS